MTRIGINNVTFIFSLISLIVISNKILANEIKDIMICPEPDAIYGIFESAESEKVYWKRLKYQPDEWELHKGFPTGTRANTIECNLKSQKLICIHSGGLELVQVVDFVGRKMIMHEIGYEPSVSDCYDY